LKSVSEKGERNQSVDWQSLDDKVLVKAFLNGDARAFEVLFKKYKSHVARLVFSIIKSETLVDDIVQEVFLLVYRNLPKFRHESAFKTWLYRITVNETLRQAAKNRRWQPLPENDPEASSLTGTLVTYEGPESPERVLLQGERKERVQRALEKVKPNQKVILTLYYIEDMSVSEISEILQIPEGSVKSRLYYARDGLKKLLDPVFVAQEEEGEKEAHVL